MIEHFDFSSMNLFVYMYIYVYNGMCVGSKNECICLFL